MNVIDEKSFMLSQSGFLRVIQLAIPLIIGNISVPLLGVIDTAVVGHLHESYDISAIGLGTTVFDFLFWAFSFLRFSTTGLIAQAKGRQDNQEMHIVVIQALGFAILLGFISVALQQPLARLIFYLLRDNSPQIIIHTAAFFHVGIWVAPIEMLTYVIIGVFIGLQQTRKILYLVLITTLLAAPLDVLFVNGLHLGAAGIAYAYILATAISFCVGLIWLFQVTELHRFKWQINKFFRLYTLKRIMVLNLNIFIRTICLLWVFTFFTTQGARFGSIILSANVVLMNFQNIMAYAADGFANVAETLVGETIGERNKQHFYRVLGYTGICSIAVGVFFCLVYLGFGRYFIEALTSIPGVRIAARTYLSWSALLSLVSVWSFWLDGIFMGATKGAILRNAMIIAVVLFMVVWWMTQAWHNQGLWFSLILFMMFRTLTLGIPLLKWLKQLRW